MRGTRGRLRASCMEGIRGDRALTLDARRVECVDLRDSGRVTPTAKARGQERLDDRQRESCPDEASAEREHVRVVVLPRVLRGGYVVAHRGAQIGIMVDGAGIGS